MLPLNPWVLLAVVLAWVASVAGVGLWQREDGKRAERVAWQERDNAALVQANATIERLNAEARATEERHGMALAEIGAAHAKDREALEVRRRADVAAVRDGAIRLRVAGACPGAGSSEAGAPAAAAGRGDDPTTGELPRATVEDLLGLANDADAIVAQLAACQAVILADRMEP